LTPTLARSVRKVGAFFGSLGMHPLRDSFPAQAVLLLASMRGGLESARRAETLDEARTLITKALEQIEFLSRLAASAAEDSEGA